MPLLEDVSDMSPSAPGIINLGGLGRSDVPGGVVLLCGKSSTTGDREVGGPEISGGASRVVKLASESGTASLPRLGDARGGGEAPPTSTGLDGGVSSPLPFAPNDVSNPPKETGGYLDLGPLEGGTELPLFFWPARALPGLVESASSIPASRPWYSLEVRCTAGGVPSARNGFITCRKLLTGLGSGFVVSNGFGSGLCGIVIGGGTLSTTDFFRRRKNEDFLFTT